MKKYLTQLYFPAQWKVGQTILMLKPVKPPNKLTFYRPISLLLIVSKVFEKLLPMIENNGLITIISLASGRGTETHQII
jgi:hypothetical protein